MQLLLTERIWVSQTKLAVGLPKSVHCQDHSDESSPYDMYAGVH